jgi:hypothetical protein
VASSDAVAREAAWLATMSGDALPFLPASAGGPWQVIQAYWPRTPRTNETGIYVLRAALLDPRAANQRVRPRYEMTLRLVWPVVVTGNSLLETAQQNLDSATDLLLQRIRGPLGDKTHGGRFLSAAENPRSVSVRFDDPERAMEQFKSLRAVVAYSVDDFDVNT